MGVIAAEEGVLKLIHRGRFAEIHKRPILAKEVMRQNPKHCITRPDFFQYPRIVVRPDSMLNLGRVFLIVPNHTVYELMKAKGYRKQPSPECLSHPSCTGIFSRRSNGTNLPRNTDAGARMTPKHQSHGNRQSRRFQDDQWRRRGPEQVQESETEYESAPESITKHQASYLEFKRMTVSATYETTSAGEEDSRVKSCLKKQESERKMQRLKVAFLLPAKGEERIQKNRTFQVYRT